MVLESLFPDKKIRSKPLDMFALSFVVTLVSIFLAYSVFPKYSGIIAPLLTAVAMAPLIYRIFGQEEEEIKQVVHKRLVRGFLQRHDDTIALFSLFFVGSFLANFLVAAFLPETFVKTSFEPQLNDIAAVQSLSKSISGQFLGNDLMSLIAVNNLKVMVFSFLLSFLFATGATFILSWNASILAIYLASFWRQGLIDQLVATTTGIFPHAVIEITAYFLAGIGGGILSAGMVREHFFTPEFKLVLRDSLMLMGMAVVFVVVGAYVEVSF